MQPATREKVLIYATSPRGLLVFDEPEFPDAPVQVPGGTVEANETPLAAAQREFREETGLNFSAFRPVGTGVRRLSKDGILHVHHRSYFHLALPEDLPDGWTHCEETPDGGGEPILLRFFWLSIAAARTSLGWGMAECLDRIGPEET